MMDEAIELPLENEAFGFVAECLSMGRGFSRALADSLTGQLSTFAAPDTPRERLSRYWQGGIHGSVPDRMANAVPIPDFDRELIKITEEHLRAAMNSLFLVENASARATDPVPRDVNPGSRVYHCGDDVFHLALNDATPDEILETLRKGRTSPYFVAALTRADSDLMNTLKVGGASLKASDVGDLARSASCIFVGAYDGESFIVWRRPTG
jgi:hypothetical protein